MKKILVLTDNDELLNRFKSLLTSKKIDSDQRYNFEYAFSFNNSIFSKKYKNSDWIRPLKVIDKLDFLSEEYSMIISIHCKQLFPKKLVNKVKCINIHPGLNPYNRGWFPQVFSIVNSLPCGATIHEIDEEIDHGLIICQKEVILENWDTSLTAYNKILDAEIELLNENIENILEIKYTTIPSSKGNLNLKKDFDELCKINLDDNDSFKNHINKLRALTHGDYLNAYYLDDKGNKIYIKLELKKI